jgi:hypothetical protein
VDDKTAEDTNDKLMVATTKKFVCCFVEIVPIDILRTVESEWVTAEWRRCELYDVINMLQADSNQNGGKKRVTTIADATDGTFLRGWNGCSN